MKKKIKASKNKTDILLDRKSAALLVFVIAFVLFIPSLNNGFIWDDIEVIENNYHRFQRVNISSMLFPERREERRSSYYRPVHRISYVVDYSLWGLNPFGYHLTNVILYSVCAVLFYFLVLLILKQYGIRAKEYIAFLSAIVFIVHPMHVESVSWIAGRTDILCGMFFLAAFLAHVKSCERNVYLLLSAPLFYLSLLSKEVAVAFPFVIIAFELIRNRHPDRLALLGICVYMVALGFYMYVRSRIIPGMPSISPDIVSVQGIADFLTETASAGSDNVSESTGSNNTFAEYISALKVMLGAYIYYLVKTVLPFSFNVFIDRVPQGLHVISFSVAVISSLLYYSYRSVKHGSGITCLCILWFFLTLGPSVLIAVFGIAATPLAERYLFLPLGAFAFFAGYKLVQLHEKRFSKNIVFTVAAVFILLCTYFTVERQFVWRDNIYLWEEAVAQAKYSAIPHLNYGEALIENGEFEQGIAVIENALNADMVAGSRMKSIAANNLGIAYINTGREETAGEWFQKGISYDPDFHKSYYHLGLVNLGKAMDSGSPADFRRAEEYFKKSIEKRRSYARAYFLLAKLYVETGRIEEAREYAGLALDRGLTEPMHSEAIMIINK